MADHDREFIANYLKRRAKHLRRAGRRDRAAVRALTRATRTNGQQLARLDGPPRHRAVRERARLQETP
jgi:hypothetical protein